MIAYEMPFCKAIIEWGFPARLCRNLVQPPPFPAEIREHLLDSYREDILRLQHLIDWDLSSWLEGAEIRASG